MHSHLNRYRLKGHDHTALNKEPGQGVSCNSFSDLAKDGNKTEREQLLSTIRSAKRFNYPEKTIGKKINDHAKGIRRKLGEYNW